MKTQTIARLALPLAVAAGLGLGCVPAVQTFTSVLTPAQAWAATDVSYNDGTYTAEGKGIGGKVPVTVTVKDGKIAEVTVGDNSETQGIGSKAIEQLPSAIVAANGTEGVDAVSGATVTSKAIFTAVDEALEQAKGGAAAEQAAPAADDKAAKDDKAADAKADEKKADDKDAKADEKAEPAAEETKADEKADKADDAKADEKAEPAAEEAKSDDKAEADDKAAKDDKAADTKDAKADDKADAAAALTDGEYTAEGKGIGGKVPVTVKVEGGKVSEVTVGDNSETQGIGSKAIEQLPAAIVEAGGTEGVDAVSGATVTSKAIFTAVDDCLEQAGTTDVAPAAATSNTYSDTSASDNKVTDSSDSLIATTDDYLGTTRFGKMSITIPDTYTCEQFDQSPTSDGNQAVEAAYSRTLSKTSAIFIKEVFLADAAADFDDPSFLIDLLVSADLKATSSDGSCETVEEMSQLGNGSYFGIYTIKLEGTDITVLGGGAVDEDGNLLLVRVFVLGNVDSDDVFEVVDSIEVNCTPESPSSSSSTSLSLSQSSRGLSGSSTRSSGSSYAPTRGEQNALNRANDYLEFMSFSRSGLIDQLEFEGYTTSEAEYAVDNCGADWDEQAVLKAEEYLDFMSFSRSGLIDQLEFEGFTYDQASSAATAVGL